MPIDAEHYQSAYAIAKMAHVPVEEVVNACLGGLRELARWDDTRALERLMDRWMADGTVLEKEIPKAQRVKENLKEFLAERDLLGIAQNRNACAL